MPSSACSRAALLLFSPSLLIPFSLCGLPGMFCGEWGLSSPSGPCWPGFFCTAGTEFGIQRAERVKRWGAVALVALAVIYSILPWISGFIIMSYNQLLSPFTHGNGSLAVGSKLACEKQPKSLRILLLYLPRAGASVPNPSGATNTSSGGPCPPGHFCPAGTSIPQRCPVGTYSDR